MTLVLNRPTERQLAKLARNLQNSASSLFDRELTLAQAQELAARGLGFADYHAAQQALTVPPPATAPPQAVSPLETRRPVSPGPTASAWMVAPQAALNYAVSYGQNMGASWDVQQGVGGLRGAAEKLAIAFAEWPNVNEGPASWAVAYAMMAFTSTSAWRIAQNVEPESAVEAEWLKAGGLSFNPGGGHSPQPAGANLSLFPGLREALIPRSSPFSEVSLGTRMKQELGEVMHGTLSRLDAWSDATRSQVIMGLSEVVKRGRSEIPPKTGAIDEYPDDETLRMARKAFDAFPASCPADPSLSVRLESRREARGASAPARPSRGARMG